ncbi:ATP-binding protein [Haloglycomyces albus]|uniref:ATP-binding protein n=1 Tax=Haloglycomyces albus TaxID=526067 RepID=UPI00046CB996|nr:ATP-binding protein [Haloglycomyces albus]
MPSTTSAKCRVRSQATAAGDVRRWLRRAPLHLNDDALADVLVIATELVTNAVRHARPLPGEILEVSYDLRADSITITVTDGGSIQRPSVRTIDLSSPGGRGMYMVNQIADCWQSRNAPDGTHWIQATLLL